MSNDKLLYPQWEKNRTPRIYYLAVGSNGVIGLRGSWRDVYSHACLNTTKYYDNQIVGWASFHSTKEYAERTKRNSDKWNDSQSYEVVELQKITAKEFNRLKRLDKKSYKQFSEQNEIIKLAETWGNN